MAAKKAAVQEFKKFRCCGALRTPENTTNAGKCRACRDKRSADWKAAHPDETRAGYRKTAAKRQESGKLAEFRIKNREAIRDYQRQYLANLPEDRAEAVRQQQREAARRYYWRNRETILQNTRIRRAEEKVAAHNASA